MSDDTSEAALRAHIRDLLLDYAYTHLTVDHVQYSENMVSEILARILKPIPTHEPGQLALLGDPFQVLKARLKFDELVSYGEVWCPTPEAMEFIKVNMNLPKGKTRTRTVWDEDRDLNYACLAHRPMTPLLSRSSRNKTPLIGKPMKRTSLSSHLSSHAVTLFVDNGEIVETKQLRLDECVDVRLTIDASTHSSLMDLQQRNPFLSRSVPRSLSNHASAFLRCRSPEYEEPFRPMSPPIFAREKRFRPSKTQDDDSILRHVRFAPLEVEEVDPDISNANMAVVNGWTTIASSASTPSLSPGTSDLDELDEESEFWRPSSSTSEPMIIEKLEAAKMDEPIFPRAERPRCGKTNTSDERPKQSLSAFITTYIPTDSSMRLSTDLSSDGATHRKPGSPRPEATASLSMLGQPPSESVASSAQLSDAPGDALDKDIRRILKFRGGKAEMKSYQDAIMHERLDEKESMFMDVPILPAPNEYLRNTPGKMGDNMSSKVSTPGIRQGLERSGFSLPAAVKKVTGLKSLNLELTWRPFTFGSKIPTHVELLGVGSVFSASQDENLMLTAVENFLADSVFPAGLANPPDSQRVSDQDSYSLKAIISDIDFSNIDAKFNLDRDFDDDVQFLFCRSDRQPPQTFHHRSFHDTPANLTDSPSNETSDFSSAITPELNSQLQTTRNAADIDTYADTFAFSPASRDIALGADHRNHQYCECPDDSRNSKRRRLNDAELDALCAMETMSQSTPLTVDPKNLVLPLMDYEAYAPYPDESNATDLALFSVNNNYMAFNPSQSLSLSLNEDDVPLEIPTYDTQHSFIPSQSLSLSLNDDNALQVPGPAFLINDTSRNPRHCAIGRNETHGVLGYPDVDVTASFPPTIVSLESVPVRNYPSQEDRGGISQDQAPASRLDLKSPEPNRRITGTINLQYLQESAVAEPCTQDAGLRVEKQEKPQGISPVARFCADDALSAFLQLLGRKTAGQVCHPQEHEKQILENNPTEETPHAQVSSPGACRSVPKDLLSVTRAFVIPDPWQNPVIEYAYLVSVDVMQQRALVCALESPRCRIGFVGRDVLSPPLPKRTSAKQNPRAHSADISIIVGPDAGVIFFPLSALPSQTANRTLLDALATHSWRFSSILLILMAFPRSRLVRATTSDVGVRDGPNLYSPPAVKAARLLRRELELREGTGEKQASCVIELAFADDVEQAAMLVRAFGDLALRDSMIDFTQYVDEEELEGEQDLAELEGMNTFCAAVILRCVTLEEFLDMSPERRTEGLSELIGKDRIEHVNAVLESRKQAMEEELSSSIETLESLKE